MRRAREGDPDDPFTCGLRESYNDLERQKGPSLDAITELDAADEPSGPTAAHLGRLEALSYLAANLAKVSRELLYELFEPPSSASTSTDAAKR